jgi:Dolichyl-phosphate-mannose-protein mannosyltransferase
VIGRLLDRPLLVVGGALALRFALAGLLFGTQLLPHDRWYFPNDDQEKYYDFARGLADGGLHPTIATIGYDLFLFPFAAATSFVLQAIPPVAIVQALLAIPAAWLLYRTGLRLAGRRAATLAAALWAVSPLVSLLYLPTSHAPADEWLGLKILTDYPGALLAILTIAIASGCREDAGVTRALTAGAVAGFAMLVKMPNIVLAGAVVAALLAWRNVRGAVLAGVAAAVVILPQLVVNERLFGGILKFGYQPSVARRYPGLPKTLQEGSWSPLNIPRVYGRLVLDNALGPVLPLLAAAALVVAWRRAPAARWLVVAPAAAYAVGLGMYHYSIGPHFLRIATPLVPLLCLAAGAALFPAEPERSERPLGHWALAVPAVVLGGAVALAAWLTVAPKDPPHELQALRPAASVANRAVTLGWRPPRAPALLSYTVWRSRSLAVPPDTVIRGFRWSFEHPDAVTALQGAPRLVDRPPPGTWFYRVLLTPGPNSHAWPPEVPVATSPPVRVTVP